MIDSARQSVRPMQKREYRSITRGSMLPSSDRSRGERRGGSSVGVVVAALICLATVADSFVVPVRAITQAQAAGEGPTPPFARNTCSAAAIGRGQEQESRQCLAAAVKEGVDGVSIDTLGDNVDVLNGDQKTMAAKLLDLGQGHVFEAWPPAGSQDEDKRRLLNQAMDLDAKYPGGVASYVSKARQLLKEAAEGLNPFEGFTPKLADGERLTFGTEEFDNMEAAGLEAVAKTAFVLVAGGLGERLGYNGIKLALPVEVTTRQQYLELYCKHILALQAKCRRMPGVDPDLKLPLVIMTSEDTDAKTKGLVEREQRFGMEEGQLIIVMQDKVPALGDSSASLVLSEKDPFSLETKPHGHGDVHHLLFREGIAEALGRKGFEWLFFFQDTNALVLNSLLPALGVSASRDYDLNSICVPRKAKEAAGAITALTKDDGSSLIINVEYNQLDPILRATVSPEGDVNDPETGLSPFPGNTNNLVFKLDTYIKALKGEDQGVVAEFVNPKYKPGSRTDFKKPTRLECMMQDFPKLMSKELGDSVKIGFTSFDKWLTFSPAKNDLESAAAAAADGVPPGTASSAEFDFYAQAVQRLKTVAGCKFEEPRPVEFAGVPLEAGPRVVLLPSFATSTADLRQKVGSGVKVSARSTLVVEGEGVALESLDLDGALIVRASEGARVSVRGLKVSNEGWIMVPLPEDASNVEEEDRVRGYLVERRETKAIEVTQPGNWVVGVDGDVTQIHFDVLEKRNER